MTLQAKDMLLWTIVFAINAFIFLKEILWGVRYFTKMALEV